MANKIRVLFLCTGNSARSQMAEALLSKIGGEKFEAYSAGLEPVGINTYTVRVLKEIGLDWSTARAKALDEFLGKKHFGYMITVCSRAEERCPIFPGMGVRLHWPFDDPASVEGTDEEKLAAFRKTRDQLELKITAWCQNELLS
jgi:arsenate reductase (thioredoxin)